MQTNFQGLRLALALAAGLVTSQATGQATGQVQVQVPPSPHFEVVSIHASQPGLRADPKADFTEDGLHFTNVPALWGILSAYTPTVGGDFAYYTNDLILGGPDWMRTERYDIDARIPEADRAEWAKPAARRELLQAMLQAMYAERFHLIVHREHQERPTFALLVGKGGPKLGRVDPEAKHPEAIHLPGDAFLVAGRRFEFYNAPMASLAIVLSNLSGRPVEDATGLPGRFDFAFDRPQGNGVPPPDVALAPDAGPSLFTILQDQLGLKLEPRKASVETLVIDRLDRPTPN